MYHKIGNKFFEMVNATIAHGRLGHNITIGASPVMRVYPLYSYRDCIEFPVFV